MGHTVTVCKYCIYRGVLLLVETKFRSIKNNNNYLSHNEVLLRNCLTGNNPNQNTKTILWFIEFVLPFNQKEHQRIQNLNKTCSYTVVSTCTHSINQSIRVSRVIGIQVHRVVSSRFWYIPEVASSDLRRWCRAHFFPSLP